MRHFLAALLRVLARRLSGSDAPAYAQDCVACDGRKREFAVYFDVDQPGSSRSRLCFVGHPPYTMTPEGPMCCVHALRNGTRLSAEASA